MIQMDNTRQVKMVGEQTEKITVEQDPNKLGVIYINVII